MSLHEPKAFVREWSGGVQLGQELHLYSSLQCHLVDYRNLTLLPLLQPFNLQGHATKKYTHSQQAESMLHFSVFLEPMLITVGQHIIHTLDTALKAWQQVRHIIQELFSPCVEICAQYDQKYVICHPSINPLSIAYLNTG